MLLNALIKLSPSMSTSLLIKSQLIKYHPIINHISVRFARNRLFVRQPLKVLTDDGHDYYDKFATREKLSPLKLEVGREQLAKHEKLNEYFDEGYLEEDLIGHGSGSGKRDRDDMVKKRKVKDEKSVHDGEKDGKKKNKKNDKMQSIKPNHHEHEYDLTSITTNHHQQSQWQEKKKSMHHDSPLPKIPGIPIYEKLGEDNREFMQMISNIKKRKYRSRESLILLEGKRIINDAIDAGLQLKVIYFTIEKNLIGINGLESLVNEQGVELKKVFYKDMKLCSELVTCPGVMAVFERPSYDQIINSPLYQLEDKLPITLITDNMRDPGNLGTLIRASAAVGVKKIICLKGCVDPWERKVLRAGAGAHFRVPIVSDLSWPLIVNHLPPSDGSNDEAINLLIADSNVQINELNDSDKIRQNEIIESLDYHRESYLEDSNHDQLMKRDDSLSDGSCLSHYRHAPISTSIYTHINYFPSNSSHYLIIGGETHGLSNQAYKLAADLGGKKIKIPLSFGVDSLNSALSASIILYEMRRQFDSFK